MSIATDPKFRLDLIDLIPEFRLFNVPTGIKFPDKRRVPISNDDLRFLESEQTVAQLDVMFFLERMQIIGPGPVPRRISVNPAILAILDLRKNDKEVFAFPFTARKVFRRP